VLTVGLTGGIGSGKSEVARRLADHGALVIDADALAREVVAPGTPGLTAVLDAFGPDLAGPDGSLDRERLGEIVFADPELRARLEAIVHPLVGARVAALTGAAPADAIVVHDVPLLVEAGLARNYDFVVVVAAGVETQVRRLTEIRGMTESAARSRITAQAPLDAKLAVADFIVDNDGPLAHLPAQVELLWSRLSERAASAR